MKPIVKAPRVAIFSIASAQAGATLVTFATAGTNRVLYRSKP